jgi:hypothetical protein
MKIKSALIEQASGSIGGLTASRNRGGMYFRGRALPTNPNTAQQQLVRGYIQDANDRWRNTLTPSQRNGWNSLGEVVKVTDSLGEERYLTGQQWYIGETVLRLQAGIAPVDDPPYHLARTSISGWAIDEVDATAQEVDLSFTAAGLDDDDDDDAVMVFISRPLNATVNYFKGPYRYAGVIEGDSVSPPTSPVSVALPFTVQAGQKIAVKLVRVRATYLASSPFRLQGLGVTP